MSLCQLSKLIVQLKLSKRSAATDAEVLYIICFSINWEMHIVKMILNPSKMESFNVVSDLIVYT